MRPLLFTAALFLAAPGAHAAPTAGPVRAAVTRAVEALGRGAYEEALRELDAIPETETGYAALAARAGAHLGQGRGKTAADLYRRALAKAPDGVRPALLFGLAEAWRVSGATEDARRVLEQLLSRPDLDPKLAALARERLP